MKFSLFYGILGISVTASFVIIIALCCRVLLKKSPKIFSYALWGVVLFGLLCLVSIGLPVSFAPDSVTDNVTMEQMITVPDKNVAETEVAMVQKYEKVEDQQETATPKATEEPAVVLQKAIDEFEIDMVFPENATCQDAELVKMSDKSLEISYWDGISEANCTLTIRKDRKKIKTDYEFDDSLTIKWGRMGEIEVKSTADQKIVCASWEENTYTFLICAIGSGEEDEQIDPSTIGKEASYIMEAFQ